MMVRLPTTVLLCFLSLLMLQKYVRADDDSQSQQDTTVAAGSTGSAVTGAAQPVDDGVTPVSCPTVCHLDCPPEECEFVGGNVPVNCGTNRQVCIDTCEAYCTCLTDCQCPTPDGCQDDCSLACMATKEAAMPTDTTEGAAETMEPLSVIDGFTSNVTDPLPVHYSNGDNTTEAPTP